MKFIITLIILTLVAAKAFAQDDPPFIKQRRATLEAAKTLGLSMRIYSDDHHGQYATNFMQLTNELGGATSLHGIKIDTFEFMNVGMVDETMPDKLIFREIKSRKNPDGKLERVYCLSDGTAYNIIPEDGNFEIYERQHTTSTK